MISATAQEPVCPLDARGDERAVPACRQPVARVASEPVTPATFQPLPEEAPCASQTRPSKRNSALDQGCLLTGSGKPSIVTPCDPYLSRLLLLVLAAAMTATRSPMRFPLRTRRRTLRLTLRRRLRLTLRRRLRRPWRLIATPTALRSRRHAVVPMPSSRRIARAPARPIRLAPRLTHRGTR
jgi:hypothetical protein